MKLIQDLPFSKLEHLLDEPVKPLPNNEPPHPGHPLSEEQLAVAYRVSAWPHEKSKPKIQNPELWKQVDSQEYARCRDAARRFIEYLIQHRDS